MGTDYTALKRVYNRKTKTYELEVVRNANLILVHNGYFVYETANPEYALNLLKNRVCIKVHEEANRVCYIGFLELE